MNRFIKICILFLSINLQSNSYAQEVLSNQIHFEYNRHSNRGIHNKIEISIRPITADSTLVVTTVDEIEKTEKKISSKKFQKLFKMALRINPGDIIKYGEFSADCADTTISFGEIINNFISYKICGLNNGDKKTRLKDFLILTCEILETGNIKIHSIN